LLIINKSSALTLLSIAFATNWIVNNIFLSLQFCSH